MKKVTWCGKVVCKASKDKVRAARLTLAQGTYFLCVQIMIGQL